MLDGNLQPVTNKKTAKALVKAEKPAKPAPEKKVTEDSAVLTGYSTQELLDKIAQFTVAFERTPDILLSIDGQWYPASYAGSDTWHLMYEHTDITTTGPLGRVKLVLSRPGEGVQPGTFDVLYLYNLDRSIGSCDMELGSQATTK